MIGAAIGYTALKMFTTLAFPSTLLVVVAWTTGCWLLVTLLTRPEPDERLIAFYRRTRPDGPGWQRIARAAGEPPPGPVGRLLIDWLAGVLLVYAILFGVGDLLLGSTTEALLFFAAAGIAAGFVSRDLARRGWKSLIE